MSDLRLTVLEVVQELFRKQGLSEPASLAANKLSVEMVDHINDVVNDLSNFGNWQENFVSANITAVTGQSDYSISTSANVKNIGDIFFVGRSGPLRNISLPDMRIMTRSSAQGTPSQFCVYGVDANGNPNIRVRPTPNQDGLFSITYYVVPPKYTTADNNTVIPFPGDLVVTGTLARAILNESGGSPTDKYSRVQQDYEQSRKETLNRFNGDTGWTIGFTPGYFGRRR